MRNKFILGGIFFIAFFLRFWQLGNVPYGFYQDESAIGYNAYSIIETGKDEHGVPFPLYFKSFGDYKLPVYIYSTIIPIKIFGLNEFSVRFPSALFGFLTVILFYFFIKNISENKNLAILSTAILAINPWHLHYNRATFEVSLSLFLYILGGLLLSYSLKNKNPVLFIFGTLSFVISIYSYNLTRLLSPLIFLLFIFYYKSNIRKEIIKDKISVLKISGVPIISLIPFIKTFLESGGLSSAKGTLILSSAAVQSPLLELRSYLLDYPIIYSKLFFNQMILTSWQYINNIATYFSPSFLFISGSSHGNHGIGNAGQMYLFELPFVLFGIYSILNKKMKWGYLFIIWSVLVILVASLTREVPHATRSFFLVIPLVLFSSYGLIIFFNRIQSLQFKKYKIIIYFLFGLFIFYNFVYYFTSYYIKFPKQYAKSWRSEDKAVTQYILQNQEKYQKIVFDKEAGFVYTSFLFYSKYSPSQFQKTSFYLPDDSEGFSDIRSFGKFEFREIDWDRDLKERDILIITTSKFKPNEVKDLKSFYYPKHPVYFAVKQNVIGYPIEEEAYVLVETNN